MLRAGFQTVEVDNMTAEPNTGQDAAPSKAQLQLQLRIKQQEARLNDLKQKAKAQAAAARQRAAAMERAKDLRRKVLIGSYVLAQLGHDLERAAKLDLGPVSFDQWMTRPQDRAVFDLAEADGKQPSS